jgi:hypothetical protein
MSRDTHLVSRWKRGINITITSIIITSIDEPQPNDPADDPHFITGHCADIAGDGDPLKEENILREFVRASPALSKVRWKDRCTACGPYNPE